MALRGALRQSVRVLRRERAAEAGEVERTAESSERQSALTDQVPDSGPVGVAEGASYSLAILAGLGVAGGSLAFLLSDLAVEPSELQVHHAALERVRADPRATARLGEPIASAEQTSAPRRSRPRVRHRAYESDDGGDSRILVEFNVIGSRNVGRVRADGDGRRAFFSGIFGAKEPELSSVELEVLSGASRGKVSVDPRPPDDRGELPATATSVLQTSSSEAGMHDLVPDK